MQTLIDPCTGSGLEEKSKEDCQAAHDACVTAYAGKEENDPIDCEGSDVGVLKDCTATVSEFANCLSVISDFARSLSCNDADKVPNPPACFQQLSKNCPALFK